MRLFDELLQASGLHGRRGQVVVLLLFLVTLAFLITFLQPACLAWLFPWRYLRLGPSLKSCV
jgi:hypothetical protein